MLEFVRTADKDCRFFVFRHKAIKHKIRNDSFAVLPILIWVLNKWEIMKLASLFKF